MLAILCLALTASPEPDPPNWNAGGGIGFNTSIAQFTSLGLSNVPVVSPFVAAGFERRLGQALWLTFMANGQYSQTGAVSIPSLVAGGTASQLGPSQRATGAGAVGLRWVVNPGGIVEVAPSFRFTASGGRMTNQLSSAGVVTSPQDSTSVNLSGIVGLVLERMLIDRLALRLSADLVSVGWTRITSAGSNADGFNAGLAFSPSLEARYYF